MAGTIAGSWFEQVTAGFMAWWQAGSQWWLWGLVTAGVAGLAEYWLTSGTSGWVPLVAGLGGVGATVLLRLTLGARKGQSKPWASTEDTKRTEKGDQAIAVSGYTIAELTSAMKGNLTSLERGRRKQLFLDKLVETRGVVSDVGKAGDRHWIDLQVDDREVSCWFDGVVAGIDSLKIGDRARIRGKVGDLGPSSVRLKGGSHNCQR